MNYCVNCVLSFQDTHQYYTSRTLPSQLGVHYYVETNEIESSRLHDTLSENHRIASVRQREAPNAKNLHHSLVKSAANE